MPLAISILLGLEPLTLSHITSLKNYRQLVALHITPCLHFHLPPLLDSLLDDPLFPFSVNVICEYSPDQLSRLDIGVLEDLHYLVLANFTGNAINWVHPRAFRCETVNSFTSLIKCLREHISTFNMCKKVLVTDVHCDGKRPAQKEQKMYSAWIRTADLKSYHFS